MSIVVAHIGCYVDHWQRTQLGLDAGYHLAVVSLLREWEDFVGQKEVQFNVMMGFPSATELDPPPAGGTK